MKLLPVVNDDHDDYVDVVDDDDVMYVQCTFGHQTNKTMKSNE